VKGMGIQVNLEKEFVEIAFTGSTLLAALKRKLMIPYSAIKTVQVGNFQLSWKAVRVGTSIPFGYKAGRFYEYSEGGEKRYFLVYQSPKGVLIFDLKGFEYDKVAIQIENASSLTEKIKIKMKQI
jgi:hypothetical protein